MSVRIARSTKPWNGYGRTGLAVVM